MYRIKKSGYKFVFIYIIFLLSQTVLSCASASVTDIPVWVASDWRTVFPDNEFLAQRGIADSAEIAKTDAFAQLARYIKMTVNSNLTTSVRSIDRNGILDESNVVQNDVTVNAQVELFGVEYTVPFYVKSEKKWYCVAFIERNRAWTQFLPNIELAKNIFYGFYDSANAEDEPIFAASFYKKAWEKGKDFLTALEYARLIHPEKEKKYSTDREEMAKIPAKIESELKVVLVRIDISGDCNGIIGIALENAFKKAGFTMSMNGNYHALVQINPNSDGKKPLAIFPEIDLKLNGISGRTVYSYKDRLSERTVAYSLETAQKKAYPVFAQKIESTVSEELMHITTETK